MSDSAAAPRRLRIAVLSRVFSARGGGAESYSIRLVEQLAGRHELHVFAQQIDHHWPGVSYHRVPRLMPRPRWLNQLWYALYTARATRGFELVHSHENTWHGQIQTVHVKPARASLLAGRGGWRRALRWLKIALSPRLACNLALEAARLRARAGRQVVATSGSLRAALLSAYPGATAPVSVITPGVKLPLLEPQPGEARRLLGLPPSGPLLLLVANDYARKGLDALLDALARLPKGTLLAVVGNAGGSAAYRESARRLGLAEQVFFLGPLKDIDLAYRAANVLAHPTLDDSFAMVVLEAMAHGLPVVVSGPAYCGISSLLQDGEQALLLDDPRDPQQLAAALGRALDDSALAARLADNARRFAAGHSWEAAARQYERLYLRAADKLTPPV